MKETENRVSSQSFDLLPISEEKQASRGWTIALNGERVGRVTSLTMEQEKMNIKITYGVRPEGYDAPIIKEAGGGGSVIVPFVKVNGEIFVGLVEENRGTCGGMVLNIPRGFLQPGETHFQTAKREIEEETGYQKVEKNLYPLEGNLMNPNSAFFVTDTPDKGVKAFKLPVESSEVKILTDSEKPEDRIYEFNPEVIKPVSKIGERVLQSKFCHWRKALEVQDMFSVAAVGRLIKEEIFE